MDLLFSIESWNSMIPYITVSLLVGAAGIFIWRKYLLL